jgi:hypothetical protein
MVRRFDGRPADVPAYRRMMPFLMRGRNESAVYFEQTFEMTRALAWLEATNRRGGPRATPFHLVLQALASMLHDLPRLNRFVAGRTICDRDGVFLTFAAKKKMDDDAPLATVKRRFAPGEGFADMLAALDGAVGEARSDRKSAVDKELAVLLKLPAPLLGLAVRALRALDGINLAPRALLEHDPMYTSAFVANLGSLKIDAAYHHLYEHGNCPLFVTVGRVVTAPVVTASGAVEARPTMQLRYSYDERIEDGHYCARGLELLRSRVEDPASWLGAAG